MPRKPPARPPDLLSEALERWAAIGARLGLSEPARTMAAAAIQLDAHPATPETALTRARLIAASPSSAMAALAELEEAGVVEARPEDPSSWIAAVVSLASPVRRACMGVLPQERRRGVRRTVLPRIEAELRRVEESLRSGPMLCALVGSPGAGRDTALELLLAMHGRDGLVRSPSALLAAERLEPEASGLVAVWDARALDISPDDRRRGASFLSRGGALSVALLDVDQEVPRVPGRTTLVVECDPHGSAERATIWRQATGAEVERRICEELRVGAGLAFEAVAVARSRGVVLDVAGLRDAVTQLLSPSSRRGIDVEYPTVRIDEVVLTEVHRRGLSHARLLARMPDDGERRRGVKVLLSGPPGTGKTLSAQAIASELGRPLYRVDLATVVSKWLGETEKNLRHAFAAARAVGAVLLFDEGEALMGQRGEVGRGSDRYANLEVAYLLQALEAHDGVVVVTTNARSKMDGAFMRRFDVVLELPRPDAASRETLWRRELGEAASRLAPAFIADIARRVELTGGHIAAAARLARAAARANARDVTEEDVLEAVAFEHDKLGGATSAARFREEASQAGAKWRS